MNLIKNLRAVNKFRNSGIIKNFLLKEKLYFAFSTFTKLLLGVLLTKFVANYYGIEGAGFVGNLFIVVSLFYLLSHGGIGLFVSENTANRKISLSSKNKIYTISLVYLIAIFILLIIFVNMFRDNISQYIFNNIHTSDLLIDLTLYSFIPIALVGFISSIFNGLSKSPLNAFSITISSLLSIFIVLIMFYIDAEYFEISLVVNYFLQFVISLYFLFRINFKFSFSKPTKKTYQVFYKFFLYTIISALLIPIFMLYFRRIIADDFGANFLSIWFSNSRLSDAYMQFFSILLISLYFPLFVNLKRDKVLSQVKNIFFIFSLFFLLLFLIFILFKHQFILLIFGIEFIDAEKYVLYFLLADYFKILSFVPTVFFLAKRKFKYVIYFELYQFLLLFLITIIFSKINFINFYYIYILSYFLYFISTSLFLYFVMIKNKTKYNAII